MHTYLQLSSFYNSLQNMTQSKLQLVKNSSGKGASVATVNRKGQQVGVLPHSSKQQPSVKLITPTKVRIFIFLIITKKILILFGITSFFLR